MGFHYDKLNLKDSIDFIGCTMGEESIEVLFLRNNYITLSLIATEPNYLKTGFKKHLNNCFQLILATKAGTKEAFTFHPMDTLIELNDDTIADNAINVNIYVSNVQLPNQGILNTYFELGVQSLNQNNEIIADNKLPFEVTLIEKRIGENAGKVYPSVQPAELRDPQSGTGAV